MSPLFQRLLLRSDSSVLKKFKRMSDRLNETWERGSFCVAQRQLGQRQPIEKSKCAPTPLSAPCPPQSLCSSSELFYYESGSRSAPLIDIFKKLIFSVECWPFRRSSKLQGITVYQWYNDLSAVKTFLKIPCGFTREGSTSW